MNKNILGIIIPLILTIVIISLSVSNIGYNYQTQTVSSIKLSDLFPGQKAIQLQEITVTNDFIMPKGIELPALTACLYNQQYNQVEQLTLEYREVDFREEAKPTLDYAVLPYEMKNQQSFDIEIFETKKLQLVLYPSGDYRYKPIPNGDVYYSTKPSFPQQDYYYNETVQRYKQYFANTDLLLVENTEYNGCYSLTAEQKNTAIKIKLT